MPMPPWNGWGSIPTEVKNRDISEKISAGGVAAAIESASGKTGAPCGACREFMALLMPRKYKDVDLTALAHYPSIAITS